MMRLTDTERALLAQIKDCKRFPIARFELRSTTEASLISTALDNVRLIRADETMDELKTRAALLRKLEEDGLLNLCYTLRVSARSEYQIFYDSEVFARLCGMVEEGRGKPGFLFDTAYIKRGVATISAKGRQALLEG